MANSKSRLTNCTFVSVCNIEVHYHYHYHYNINGKVEPALHIILQEYNTLRTIVACSYNEHWQQVHAFMTSHML